MSCYLIKVENGHKVARSINSREEYLALRGSSSQLANLRLAREGNDAAKRRLVQFNYSCLPNRPSPQPSPVKGEGVDTTAAEYGVLKGCKMPSNTVGMDVDLHREDYDDEAAYAKALAEIPAKVLAKKEELGLLMLERSATKGYHLVFRRHFMDGIAEGKMLANQERNLRWASDLLGVEFDNGAKDITRVFFSTSASTEDLIYLDDSLFGITEACGKKNADDADLTDSTDACGANCNKENPDNLLNPSNPCSKKLDYLGIGYDKIIRKWWELYNDGQEPCSGNRNTLTFELAVNLRHICGFDRQLLNEVIPDYWAGEGSSEKLACIDSALNEKRTQMPKRLKEVLASFRTEPQSSLRIEEMDDVMAEDDRFYYNKLPKLPLGVRDSVEAVGPSLSMPVLTAICPAIGMLATGVRLDVHGKQNSLNLIAYIAGDFASGKGSIDPVVDAWTAEVKALDKMYQMQEEEWRAKKRAAKNKKEQPEEPKLPVRCLTLNNTVANLAERLANTEGRHAFSFTPEADTVAQKWKSAMSDFSVMLRQSYDGTAYEREARSAEAVNVHIDHLLWNVTMCGTPDALYRVVNNYTDGFQSRMAIARTPDNTFAPLDDDPPVLTDMQTEHIHQVAHLLPLMTGQVTLPKLEAKGREWVEQIRLETMKNDDKVRARQRFRICVTAQRMTCCLMLCKVAESLIAKHGFSGAEKQLKANPSLWKEMLLKAQTPQLLEVYDVVADHLLDNALFFFRDRIEQAFSSRDYAGGVAQDRQRLGRNDSIFSRLEVEFSFEQAMQHSVAVKGAGVSRNQVRQMLKNWKKQGLIVQTEALVYRKLS